MKRLFLCLPILLTIAYPALAQEEKDAPPEVPSHEQMNYIISHLRGYCPQSQKLDCDPEEQCVMFQVECVRAPCPPVPQCVPKSLLPVGGR